MNASGSSEHRSPPPSPITALLHSPTPVYLSGTVIRLLSAVATLLLLGA